MKFTGAERTTFLDDPVEFDAGLDLNEHSRVFVKMALELLAVHRPILARRSEVRDAAAFVRVGEPHIDAGWDTGTASPLRTMRPFWHSCEVWSAGTNLIAKVVLFGAYPVSVALTCDWRGEPVTAVHVVDPVAGRVVFDSAASEDGPLPPKWPERTAEVNVIQAHMNEFGRALSARMAEVTSKASAKSLWEGWTQELAGRAPGPDDLARLARLVEAECETLQTRRSGTAPMSLADFYARVRHHYQRLEREHGPAPRR